MMSIKIKMMTLMLGLSLFLTSLAYSTANTHWVYKELQDYKERFAAVKDLVSVNASITADEWKSYQNDVLDETKLETSIAIDQWATGLKQALNLPKESAGSLLQLYVYGLESSDAKVISRENAIGGLVKLLTLSHLKGSWSGDELKAAEALVDRQAISERQRTLVEIAFVSGLIDSNTALTFRPKASLNHAEAISILDRVMRKYSVKPYFIQWLWPSQHWSREQLTSFYMKGAAPKPLLEWMASHFSEAGIADQSITVDQWQRLLLVALGKSDSEESIQAAADKLGVSLGQKHGISREKAVLGLMLEFGHNNEATVTEKTAAAKHFRDYTQNWDRNMLTLAYAHGFIQGDPEGWFYPFNSLTYAEAAVLAMRIVEWRSMNHSPEPPVPVKPEEPAAMSWEEEAGIVVIQSDTNPRLRSPISIEMPPTDQDFTLHFAEPMDRTSVEQAVLMEQNAEFQFQWEGDQTLRLKVNATKTEQLDEWARSYGIRLSGARTQTGKVLRSPPYFQVKISLPQQLWKVSVDGKVRERLTAFADPYRFQMLDFDQQYAMIKRFTNYCECDVTPSYLHGIYDVNANTFVEYPMNLSTNYVGPGDFYADKRGFFYHTPAEGVPTLTHEGIVHLKVAGYVHGSAYSKDGKHVMMAVGDSKEQEQDLDLVIYDLTSGREQRLSHVLVGVVEESQVSSANLPVVFQDDGTSVYFTMRHPEALTELRYRYNWQEGSVMVWELPIPVDQWANYAGSSDDNLYRIFGDEIYKADVPHYNNAYQYYAGYWLPGTHLLVYKAGHELNQVEHSRLRFFDADLNQHATLLDPIPTDSRLLGTSRDGKWLYLETSGDLSEFMESFIETP